MNVFLSYFVKFGYASVFGFLMLGVFGLPIPDEALLTFCGFLVSTGRLAFVPTLLAGFLGASCGITISFYLGKKPGRALRRKYGKVLHIDDALVQKAHGWFRRGGKWVLTFGYFVPGLRHVTAIAAGASEMEYRSFAAWAYPGAFLWCTAFLLLGIQVGARWESILEYVHSWFMWSVLAIAAIFAVFLAVRTWKTRYHPASGAERKKSGNS